MKRQILLSQTECFSIDNGKRIRKCDIDKTKGDIPVYSASKFESETLGYVSDKIKDVVPDAKKFTGKYITINADGSVGKCFLREKDAYVNDIVNVIKIKHQNILYEYLLYELRNKLSSFGSWRNKLYKEKLGTIYVEIPIDAQGNFDKDEQLLIYQRYKKIDSIKRIIDEKIEEIGKLQVKVESDVNMKSLPLHKIFDFPPSNSGLTRRHVSLNKQNDSQIPVYSASKDKDFVFGWIDKKTNWKYYENVLTWNTDGVYAGCVFYREEKFIPYEKIKVLKIKEEYSKTLDYEYLRKTLEIKLRSMGFGFRLKCSMQRVHNLEINIPVINLGQFDIIKQREIAHKNAKIEEYKNYLINELKLLSRVRVQLE